MDSAQPHCVTALRAPQPFTCAAAGVQRGGWGRALVLALLAHGAVAAGVRVAMRAPPPPQEAQPPELVFLAARAPAPPPGPVAPALPQRAARARPTPRRLVVPATVPTVVPTALPPATPEPETSADASAPGDVALSGAAPAGPSAGGGGPATGGLGTLEGTDGPLTLAQVSRAPQVLARVAPRYPREARRERLEGRVVLRLVVGVDGRVEPESVRVLVSVPGLDDAAAEAVRHYRFTPALGVGGQAVRVRVDLPIAFSLR